MISVVFWVRKRLALVGQLYAGRARPEALFLGNLLSNPLLLIRMHLNGTVAWLSARSASFKEKRSSLYALIATNIAMVVTTTILSFKPKPEVTLQEYVALLLQYSNLRFTESSNN